MTAYIAIPGIATSGVGAIKCVIMNSNVTVNQYATNSPTVFGHANASGVISVGAVDAQGTTHGLEFYSGVGGVPILFDTSGNPLSQPVYRQVPDVVAPDDVSVTNTFNGGFQPYFRGTSAAAPHVAGVIALLKQLNPSATPAALKSALETTATDMGTPGFDYQTGFGLVNALDAEYSMYKPSAPSLAAGSDNGLSSTDNVTSVTSPTLTGSAPAGSYVVLYDNGALITFVQLSSTATAYSLTESNAVANRVHNFTVRMKSSVTPSTFSAGYSLPSATTVVYVDSLAATQPTAAAAPHISAATDTGYSNSDGITYVTNPVLTGTVDAAAAGGYVTLWIDNIYQGYQQLGAAATLYSIPALTLANGNHTATIRVQQIPSAPSSSYYNSPGTSIVIDTAPPHLLPISVPNSHDPLEAITINFDKAVYGLSVAGNFTLTKNGTSTNRLTLDSPQLSPSSGTSTSYSLSRIEDVTMVVGNYSVNVVNPASIYSAAGIPLAAGSSGSWQQTNTTYQNPKGYFDTSGDGYISPIDSLVIINYINTYGTGQLPLNTGPTPNVDTNGDGYISPIDSLLVVNYLNEYGNSGTPIPQAVTIGGGVASGGGPSFTPISPGSVTAAIVLDVVDASGNAVTSVKVGDQFQVRATLQLTGPAGVTPFAGYSNLTLTPNLVASVTSSNDVGTLGATMTSASYANAGRIVYGLNSSVLWTKTFVATKSGTLDLGSTAAQQYGDGIFVVGLSNALPLSQITFTGTTLTIK